MRKVGFIDYYIDEWHANTYPALFRERAKALQLDWEIAYVYAELDKPGGISTLQWCEREQVHQVSSIEQLVALSDAILILSPDHPEHHQRLSEYALKSGKPVYIDKTFAPNVEIAKQLFELAKSAKTPLFSSSALRYGLEIQEMKAKVSSLPISYLSVMGPGKYSNYAVHQFEMIVTLMGIGAKRVKSLSNKQGTHIIVEYENQRQATFTQLGAAPFQAILTNAEGESFYINHNTHMFEQLIEQILRFFETGIAPISSHETIEVMALIQAGAKAIENHDDWITVL